MSREELKRLFLTFPTLDIPEKKEIIVDYNNNPHWPGYGSVEVLSDGPDGYSSFKSHQENPFLFVSEREEFASGEYKLIIK